MKILLQPEVYNNQWIFFFISIPSFDLDIFTPLYTCLYKHHVVVWIKRPLWAFKKYKQSGVGLGIKKKKILWPISQIADVNAVKVSINCDIANDI